MLSIRLVLKGVLFLIVGTSWAQVPFNRVSQVFAIMESTNALTQITINPANGGLVFTPISGDLGRNINAIGFRKTDNLLYGIDQDNLELIRMDAQGNLENLGDIGLDNSHEYIAGDISRDGRFFYLVASRNERDQNLVRIDLDDFSFELIPFVGDLYLSDIAVDPTDGIIYGFNAKGRNTVRIQIRGPVLNIFGLTDIFPGEIIEAVYFNAFGDLYGYGNTAGGIASATYLINKENGREIKKSTGPGNSSVKDMASVPYSVEVKNSVSPQNAFPCEDITFTYQIANQTESVLTNLNFESELPPGFEVKEVINPSFGGQQSYDVASGLFRLSNVTIPTGVKELTIIAETGDIPAGDYLNQAVLSGLTSFLGTERLSDDPNTNKLNDPTKVIVNFVDGGDVTLSRFLCADESLILDGSEFGNNLKWWNGATTPTVEVEEGGTYRLEASTNCQTVIITYDVAVASCPFTIELWHEVIPNEIFPCNEVIFRFVFENDSGVEYKDLEFFNALPEGFTFIETLNDPFGGDLKYDEDLREISIMDMALPAGIDTLDFIVEVGDIEPRVYRSRAKVSNFPQRIGPFRLSSDPNTLMNDSTAIEVLGVDADTTLVEVILCDGNETFLDAQRYGTEFLWENGSTEPTFLVTQPGIFELEVFSGCQSSFVFFVVEQGDPIQIEIDRAKDQVNLGESIELSADIDNSVDSLYIIWKDPLDTTLSCTECLQTIATPLDDITYKAIAYNGVCVDSTEVKIIVDKTRRVFASNVFSPNFDGRNDYFFISSPDFGILKSLQIYDRWGNQLFATTESVLNFQNTGWDGTSYGEILSTGVYLWVAEIEFLDRKTEFFTGDILLIK